MLKKYVFRILFIVAASAVLLAGCASGVGDESDHDVEENVGSAESTKDDLDVEQPGTESNHDIEQVDTGSTIISGALAREIYESNDSVILLDVRNQDEFESHHIENSILIPYTELESRLSELPDKDAIIIVFCRAGRRSAIAADILVANGYTNVYDMQEVTNW